MTYEPDKKLDGSETHKELIVPFGGHQVERTREVTDAQKLDGSENHKDMATPFDAHEQATRGEHVPTMVDGPTMPAGQEFPKAVGHVEVGAMDVHDTATGELKTIGGHLEPIIAKDAAHEQQLNSQ